MIVEFTGCSGAGKTVLREAVVQELDRRGLHAHCPLTHLLGRRWSRLRENPSLANLIIDCKLLPRLAMSRLLGGDGATHAFRIHCERAINSNSKSIREKASLQRSLYRKLALHAQLQKVSDPTQIILVDEGIVHLAHMIHGRKPPHDLSSPRETQHLEEFSSLAPAPDLLVLVDAPLQLLERRISERNSHQPLPGQSAVNRRQYLRLASALNGTVIKSLSRSACVITVENHQQDPDTLKHHAQHVADAIREIAQVRTADRALINQRSDRAA